MVRLLIARLMLMSVIAGGTLTFSALNHFRPVSSSIQGRPVNVSTIVLDEAKSPALAATVEPAVAANPKQLTIQSFGDIMVDRNVYKNMGGHGLGYIFEHVTGTPLFGDADITVANLEGPFAPTRLPTSKSIAFRFDPIFAIAFKQLGFTAFNLANNHSNDMGPKNVTFTRNTLQKFGIGYFGDELNEGPVYTWYSSTTPRVAFIGIHNTYHEPNMALVKQAIEQAKKQAPLVIINVHWGVEYNGHSNKKQQTLAHQLIDMGADAIIGHHPHVVEEMEVYNNKPIFYSLGNFIFDQYFSKHTQEGLSVVLSYASTTLTRVTLRPFYSVKSQIYYPVEGERRAAFLTWFTTSSRFADKKLEGSVISW
jgi:poly-gamma-glutamate synthesis protein (capsule biosynthesis protein)